MKKGDGYKLRKYSAADYGAVKIHFGDQDGLHLCIARRGFKNPLQVTQDSSEVTCQNCIAGYASKEWEEKKNANRS